MKGLSGVRQVLALTREIREAETAFRLHIREGRDISAAVVADLIEQMYADRAWALSQSRTGQVLTHSSPEDDRYRAGRWQWESRRLRACAERVNR